MLGRITISSVNSFANLARQHPSILNVGAFNLLRDVILKPKKSGCNCGGGGAIDLSAYRPQFESALTMLTDADKQAIKTILSTQQVCYYTKNGQGQLKQYCF